MFVNPELIDEAPLLFVNPELIDEAPLLFSKLLLFPQSLGAFALLISEGLARSARLALASLDVSSKDLFLDPSGISSGISDLLSDSNPFLL